MLEQQILGFYPGLSTTVLISFCCVVTVQKKPKQIKVFGKTRVEINQNCALIDPFTAQKLNLFYAIALGGARVRTNFLAGVSVDGKVALGLGDGDWLGLGYHDATATLKLPCVIPPSC